MKNKNRGHGNNKELVKPFPITPESRNIKVNWINYTKLRMIKNKFEYSDFDSVINYLILCWRKNARA